jgi:hypothetical protein
MLKHPAAVYRVARGARRSKAQAPAAKARSELATEYAKRCFMTSHIGTSARFFTSDFSA